jgi:hypothetical protein
MAHRHSHKVVFPAAFAFAHLAFAALEILALAAALIFLLPFFAGFSTPPFNFAHRFFWAWAIRFLPATLITLRCLGLGEEDVAPPKIFDNSDSRASICSLIWRARFNCWTVGVVIMLGK